MVKAKYRRVLAGYLDWCGEGLFLRPAAVEYAADGPSAEECMKRWESEGVLPVTTSDPALLQRYQQGKMSRDWHVTHWKEGVAAGLFQAEEFVGTLGLRRENFRAVFGREVREAFLAACEVQVGNAVPPQMAIHLALPTLAQGLGATRTAGVAE